MLASSTGCYPSSELVLFRPTAGDTHAYEHAGSDQAGAYPRPPDVLSSQAAAIPFTETAAESAPHQNPSAGTAADSAAECAWQLVGAQPTERTKPYPLSYEVGRHRGRHRDPIGAALGAVWVLGNIVTLLLLGWIANGQLTEQGAGQSPGSYAGSPDTPLP